MIDVPSRFELWLQQKSRKWWGSEAEKRAALIAEVSAANPKRRHKAKRKRKAKPKVKLVNGRPQLRVILGGKQLDDLVA